MTPIKLLTIVALTTAKNQNRDRAFRRGAKEKRDANVRRNAARDEHELCQSMHLSVVFRRDLRGGASRTARSTPKVAFISKRARKSLVAEREKRRREERAEET